MGKKLRTIDISDFVIMNFNHGKYFIILAGLLIIIPISYRCTPVVKEYRELKTKSYIPFQVTGKQPLYSGDSLTNLSFPVGGMGQGYISFGGRGNIQSFSLPGMDGDISLPMTFFAIHARERQEFNSVENVEFEPVVRMLEAELPSLVENQQSAYHLQEGIPRFRKAGFEGMSPFGLLKLEDRNVPVKAEMEVFNPLIPLDHANSSLPACIIRWKIINPFSKPVDVSVVFSIYNPSCIYSNGEFLKAVEEPLEFTLKNGYKGIMMSSNNLCISGLPETSIKLWSVEEGLSFHAQKFWSDFADDGLLNSMKNKQKITASPAIATMQISAEIGPGEEYILPFILTWERAEDSIFKIQSGIPEKSMDLLSYIIEDMDSLYDKSIAFSNALHSTSVPDYALDAISQSFLQLQHGSFQDSWTFSTLPSFVFPELDRTYRKKFLTSSQESFNSLNILFANLIQAYMHWQSLGDDWLDENLDYMMDALEYGEHQLEKMNAENIDIRTGSLHLATLKAFREIAVNRGSNAMIDRFQLSYEKAEYLYEKNSWDGEYYRTNTSGCHADQLIGLGMASAAGLGALFDHSGTLKALHSIYRYNYRSSFAQYLNFGEANVRNQEGGLLTCTWPHGDRPQLSSEHAEEAWAGMEYSAAALMVRAGMIEEGLDLIRTSRNRFRGYNRNPFIIQAGDPYLTRSAWELYLALSGFQYRKSNHSMEFNPQLNQSEFNSVWISDSAWGEVRLTGDEIKLKVLYGNLYLKKLILPGSYNYKRIEDIKPGEAELMEENNTTQIILTELLNLSEGNTLTITFRQ